VINNKYEHVVDGAGDHMDLTQFYPLFIAGIVFFALLFALNLKKPKEQ
jgi:hypothetical protein